MCEPIHGTSVARRASVRHVYVDANQPSFVVEVQLPGVSCLSAHSQVSPMEQRNSPWRQLQKRSNTVAVAMCSREWKYFIASAWLRPGDRVLPKQCAPPDPTDLNMSKKSWEKGIQEWRRVLQSLQKQEE